MIWVDLKLGVLSTIVIMSEVGCAYYYGIHLRRFWCSPHSDGVVGRIGTGRTRWGAFAPLCGRGLPPGISRWSTREHIRLGPPPSVERKIGCAIGIRPLYFWKTRRRGHERLRGRNWIRWNGLNIVYRGPARGRGGLRGGNARTW